MWALNPYCSGFSCHFLCNLSLALSFSFLFWRRKQGLNQCLLWRASVKIQWTKVWRDLTTLLYVVHVIRSGNEHRHHERFITEAVLLTSKVSERTPFICSIKKSHKNLISFFQFNFIFSFNTSWGYKSQILKSYLILNSFTDLLSCQIINQRYQVNEYRRTLLIYLICSLF